MPCAGRRNAQNDLKCPIIYADTDTNEIINIISKLCKSFWNHKYKQVAGIIDINY